MSKKKSNATRNDDCAGKVNKLEPCREGDKPCSCSPTSGSDKGSVDLVLLIDSSSTMAKPAKLVNDAAAAALEKAKAECGADVRETWLWVDFAKPGSSSLHNLGNNAGNFLMSHQQYLENKGASGFYHDVPDSAGSNPREQGADAIADISAYFDWREGACRSIIYFSDTALEGKDSTPLSNDDAVAQAIGVANANDVTVFAHKIGDLTGGSSLTLNEIFDDYHQLCSSTGGQAITGGNPSVELYVDLISKAVCECGGGCSVAEIPELKPCISISWGDSKCDSFETDDFEKLCISACNCYSNVAFSNLVISSIQIVDASGNPVATLPDGTPSVDVIPHGPICFGDIPPCIDGKASCVSREFAIRTCGAIEGDYQLLLGDIRFEMCHAFESKACFKVKLCKS